MTITEIQTALKALGYLIFTVGVMDDATETAVEQFQFAHGGLVVDGDPGPKTQAALKIAIERKAMMSVPPQPAGTEIIVPADWMPDAKMTGIVVHWSAGQYQASALDRLHYHVMIEGDGQLVHGDRSIRANAAPLSRLYAAHTLGHNTGIIGVALCCMGGAVEAPFSSGRWPMTKTQWDVLPGVLAALCRRYGIPLNRKTVLSHAEVARVLGIRQRGKWDISRLSFDPSVVGASAVGDLFRARAGALLSN